MLSAWAAYAEQATMEDIESADASSAGTWLTQRSTGSIVIGFLLLSVKGLEIIFWIIALIRYQTTELVITNKRIIAKVGLIRRRGATGYVAC
jgi:hypothetical protein